MENDCEFITHVVKAMYRRVRVRKYELMTVAEGAYADFFPTLAGIFS